MKKRELPEGLCAIYRLYADGYLEQYIGRTVTPSRRERFHWEHPINGRVREWKNRLILENKKFKLEIIALCKKEYVQEVETAVIRQTKSAIGSYCLNFWDGSQTLDDVWAEANRVAHQTESFRAKMRARQIKPETKEILSKAQKARLSNPKNHPRYGVKLSEETKAKISASERGKKISKEHIDAISRLDVPAEECVKLYLAGNSTLSICKHFKCSQETVRNRLIKAGISRRRRYLSAASIACPTVSSSISV